MPRRLLAFAAAFVLTFLLLASPSFAEEKFRVSSYIPDKFHDFQWLISGGTGMAGRCDTHAKRPTDVNLTWLTDSRSESNDFSLALNSYLDYRYETIQRAFDLQAVVEGTSIDGDDERDEYTRNLPYSDNHGMNRSDKTRYDLSVGATSGFDQYLASDFFLEVYGYAQFKFRDQTWGSSNTNTYYYFDTSKSEIVNVLDFEEERNRVTRKDHAFEGRILAGWGRLYEGRYGATALYIIDYLRRRGLLTRTPDYDQMKRLARLIHTRREQSYSDQRWHRISSLDSIITYLVSTGAIGDPGPYGQLLVQDVWDYFPNYRRSFGWRVRGGLVGEQTRDSYDQWVSTETKNLTVREYLDSAGLVDTTRQSETNREHSWNDHHVTHTDYFICTAEYHWPATLHWQFSWAAEARWYLNRRQEERDDASRFYYHDLLNRYGFDITSDVRYIFDSRTDLYSSIALRYYHEDDIRSTTYHDSLLWTRNSYSATEKHNWSALVNCALTYRISPPTTLTVDLYVDWQRARNNRREDSSEEDEFGYTLNTTLAHYLF